MLYFNDLGLPHDLTEAATNLRGAADPSKWRRMDQDKIVKLQDLAVTAKEVAAEIALLVGTYDEAEINRALIVPTCRYIMADRGISAAEVAKGAGLTRQTVSHVLSGTGKAGAKAEEKVYRFLMNQSE